jgi:hypothetical protein
MLDAAKKIARLVAAHSVEPNEIKVLCAEEFDDELPDSVCRVRIYGLPEPTLKDHWTVAGAGWVAPLTSQHIDERIQAKAALLPNYRKVVAENWLVIVSEGRSPSQFFDQTSIKSLDAFESPFERTYFYDHFNGTVIQLTRA